MARPSSIDKLPPEIQNKIADLRREGVSIDRIMAALVGLGVEISRTALGRHTKELDELIQEAREAKLVGDALRAGCADGSVAATNIELAERALFKINMALRSKQFESTEDLLDAMQTVSAVNKNLAIARKADIEASAKLRLDAETRAKKAAAEEAVAEMTERGLSPQTISAIKLRILGVKVPA